MIKQKCARLVVIFCTLANVFATEFLHEGTGAWTDEDTNDEDDCSMLQVSPQREMITNTLYETPAARLPSRGLVPNLMEAEAEIHKLRAEKDQLRKALSDARQGHLQQSSLVVQASLVSLDGFFSLDGRNSTEKPHSGIFIVDVAGNLLGNAVAALGGFFTSVSRLPLVFWAIFVAITASILLALIIRYHLQTRGYVGPGNQGKRAYPSWAEKQAASEEPQAEDDEEDLATRRHHRGGFSIFRSLHHCLEAEHCYISAASLKALFVILIVFGVSSWLMWRSGVIQPVLKYVAVYAYIIAFCVAIVGVALFELWGRCRDEILGNFAAIGHLQKGFVRIEKALGIA
eukprot:TRINITY_DN94542_c0_g1_i1.p1 TRINITY_DN94542_c0_g1~~TRINITY_DN94542_c0_g1_i1.p1  ORF type:complete len:344 (+),score=50.93 TRINITY_DN94542_c0_g1_i1:121-1152(+)